MRKLALTLTVLLVLGAHAPSSRAQGRWRWNAPDGEEFAVLMPGAAVRVRRELPFAARTKLTPPVYEAEGGDVRFSVLSFDRRGPHAFDSLDAFAEGFRYALVHSPVATDNELTFERDLTLNGHDGKQYSLHASGRTGTARIYETPDHYYVVLSVGAAAGEPSVDRFFNSFVLDDRKSGEPSGFDPADLVARRAPEPPPPLWSVAGSPMVLGRADPAPPGSKPSGAKPKTIISGGVLDGKAVSKPQPSYPAIARAARAQGTVTVQIVIDEEGYVISAQAVSGHPLLQQAAVEAARQARFSPTLLEGQPVKVSGVITYNFVLQ